MPDTSEAYIGQPRHNDLDPYSIGTDYSDPQQPNKERGAMDSLNPNRPSGIRDTGKPISPHKTIVPRKKVRWHRGRK